MNGLALRNVAKRRLGFTLIELLLVIAIVALLVSIILPSLGTARKTARMTQSLSNMKQLGLAANAYANEFKEAVPSLSWQAGRPGSGFDKSETPNVADPLGISAGNDTQAAAEQAAWIITRRASPSVPNFSDKNNWFPYARYSHLVLVDFLATPIPGPSLYSPFDFIRNRWAEVFRQTGGDYLKAYQSIDEGTHGGRGDSERTVFSSSYQTSAAAITPNLYPSATSGGLRQANNEGAINAFDTSGVGQSGYRMGGRKWTEATFPSQKVWMFEDVSWHVNPRATLHYTNPAAVNVVVLFDGSARLLKQSEAAPGGYLDRAGSVNPNAIARESIALWQSPEGNGNSCIGVPIWIGGFADPQAPLQINMMYRFTVGGLGGIDIGRPIRAIKRAV